MTRKVIEQHLTSSIETKQKLLEPAYIEQIEFIATKFAEAIRRGGKLMFCGNGGSAADAQHLAAELVIRLRGSFNRPPIAALALTTDSSVLTAGGNDYGFDSVFARQVEALGRPEDILVAISTSGNSPNVLQAVEVARKKHIYVIGLTGGDGGRLKTVADFTLVVPSHVTAHIQESHITIGHIVCQLLEEALFP